MLWKAILLISMLTTSLFSQTPSGTYKIWVDSLRVDSSGTFIDVTERLHTTYGKYLHSSAKDTIRAIVSDSLNPDGVTIGVNGSSQLYILPDAISSTHIRAASIGTTDLANGIVSAAKIQAYTITDNEIADGAITDEKLAANSVMASHITTGAVGVSEIATNAVGTDEIINYSIQTADIDTNAVTVLHIVSALMDSIRAVNTIQICSASDLLIKDSTFVGTWGKAYVSNTVNAQDSMYFNVPVPYYMKNDVVELNYYKVTFVGTGLCGVVALNLYEVGGNGTLTGYDKDETGWSVDDEVVAVDVFVNSDMPTNPLILEVVIFPDTELKITNIEFSWR